MATRGSRSCPRWVIRHRSGEPERAREWAVRLAEHFEFAGDTPG